MPLLRYSLLKSSRKKKSHLFPSGKSSRATWQILLRCLESGYTTEGRLRHRCQRYTAAMWWMFVFWCRFRCAMKDEGNGNSKWQEWVRWPEGAHTKSMMLDTVTCIRGVTGVQESHISVRTFILPSQFGTFSDKTQQSWASSLVNMTVLLHQSVSVNWFLDLVFLRVRTQAHCGLHELADMPFHHSQCKLVTRASGQLVPSGLRFSRSWTLICSALTMFPFTYWKRVFLLNINWTVRAK